MAEPTVSFGEEWCNNPCDVNIQIFTESLKAGWIDNILIPGACHINTHLRRRQYNSRQTIPHTVPDPKPTISDRLSKRIH